MSHPKEAAAEQAKEEEAVAENTFRAIGLSRLVLSRRWRR